MPQGKVHKRVEKEVKSKVHEVVRKELKNRTAQAIITAFALVIALAWQDAIKEMLTRITEILQVPQNLYFYKIISAMILTFICVIGIIFISRSLDKGDK